MKKGVQARGVWEEARKRTKEEEEEEALSIHDSSSEAGTQLTQLGNRWQREPQGRRQAKAVRRTRRQHQFQVLLVSEARSPAPLAEGHFGLRYIY